MSDHKTIIPTEAQAPWIYMLDDNATEEERSAYRIGGKSEAAWAMEHLKGYQDQVEENNQVAADRIAAVKAWRDEENAKLQHHIDFFVGVLNLWHRQQITADYLDEEAWKKEKFKTISLPDGKLEARRSTKTEVTDANAFEKWALANQPEWLRTKYEPIKDEIKKAEGRDPETGEIVPGVELTEELNWKVTPNK